MRHLRRPVRLILIIGLALFACSTPRGNSPNGDTTTSPILSDSGPSNDMVTEPADTVIVAGDAGSQTDAQTGQDTLTLDSSGQPSDTGVAPDTSSQSKPIAINPSSETAGGGTLSSKNYRLQLYVAPSRPVAWLKSSKHQLLLGPSGGQQ